MDKSGKKNTHGMHGLYSYNRVDGIKARCRAVYELFGVESGYALDDGWQLGKDFRSRGSLCVDVIRKRLMYQGKIVGNITHE